MGSEGGDCIVEGSWEISYFDGILIIEIVVGEVELGNKRRMLNFRVDGGELG